MKKKFLISILLTLGAVAFTFRTEIQETPVFQKGIKKIEEEKKKVSQVLGEKVLEEGERLKQEKEPEARKEVTYMVERIKEEVDRIVKEKTVEVKELSQEEMEKLKKEIMKEVKQEICENLLKED